MAGRNVAVSGGSVLVTNWRDKAFISGSWAPTVLRHPHHNFSRLEGGKKKAQGCSLAWGPECWGKIAPAPESEASTSTMNGFVV